MLLTFDRGPSDTLNGCRMRQREVIGLDRISSERRNGPNADLVTVLRQSDHQALVRGQEDAAKGALKKSRSNVLLYNVLIGKIIF